MNTRREALILLNLTQAIGVVTLGKLQEAFGSPEAAVGRPERALASAGLGNATCRKIAALRQEDLERELAAAEKDGVGIITLADPDYPASLRNIFDPPPVLYYKGRMERDDSLAVAVVGSRHPTLYGMSTAKAFAAGLVEHGFTVVSGMARGIDTQAHAGALEAGGRTVAVMGSGFRRIYPAENRKLAETIGGSGCVLTEFPMECGPAKQNFPRRNRVISGLSLGVLVVEAGRTSGALITADFALEQGREVFAVPGCLDSRASQGSNNLIREGAKLAASVDDIIEELPPCIGRTRASDCAGCETNAGRNSDGGQAEKRRSVTALSPEEDMLYAIISGEGVSLDELARRSGLGVCRLSGLLLRMQLAKLIRRMPGNIFSRDRT
jgi:DNA processing protein